MAEDLSHRCRFAALCRSYTVIDGRRIPQAVAGPEMLCEGCQRLVTRALRQLPRDWCKLKITLGESARIDTEPRRTKPGSRVLINLAADELMDRIAQTCERAGAMVADRVNIKPNRPRTNRESGSEFRRMCRSISILILHIDKLLDNSPGIDAGADIVKLHQQAARHLGETQQRERLHLPCPSCGNASLVREVQDRRGRSSGDDGTATPEVVRCLSCDGGPSGDGTWTETEYEWLSHMVLSEREEHNVLSWLLAEAQWRLEEIGKIVSIMSNDDSVAGFSPQNFAVVLGERLPPDVLARIHAHQN